MTFQRIKYINKAGEPYDMVLKIIKKQSKVIIVMNPEDESIISIPRGAVISISEDKMETEEK